MRKRLMIGAAIASVGLGGVAVSAAGPTSTDAATSTLSKVTQLTWIGPHPDSSAGAPAGEQRFYVIDAKRNTIKYLGTTATTTWTQARVDQAVARSTVPVAVVFDKQGKVLNVLPSRRVTQP